MAFKRKTADDIADRGNQTLPDGWYQFAVKSYETKETKATQKKLDIQFKPCAEEGNPESATGSVVFYQCLFSEIGDDATFRQSVIAKLEKSGKPSDADSVDDAIRARMRMADDGTSNLGIALFGYDAFSPVPIKDKSTGKYELPDGTEVPNYNDRQTYFKARDAEAINAVYDVAEGKQDVTTYLVYGLVHTTTFNGNQKNEIKKLRPSLPAGEILAKM